VMSAAGHSQSQQENNQENMDKLCSHCLSPSRL
jgi:hypothetical protein